MSNNEHCPRCGLTVEELPEWVPPGHPLDRAAPPEEESSPAKGILVVEDSKVDFLSTDDPLEARVSAIEQQMSENQNHLKEVASLVSNEPTLKDLMVASVGVLEYFTGMSQTWDAICALKKSTSKESLQTGPRAHPLSKHEPACPVCGQQLEPVCVNSECTEALVPPDGERSTKREDRPKAEDLAARRRRAVYAMLTTCAKQLEWWGRRYDAGDEGLPEFGDDFFLPATQSGTNVQFRFWFRRGIGDAPIVAPIHPGIMMDVCIDPESFAGCEPLPDEVEKERGSPSEES